MKSIPILRANEQLQSITINNYSNLKPESQKRILADLKKQASSYQSEVKKKGQGLSNEELFKMIAGR